MKKKILVQIKRLHDYASEPWYPLVLGVAGFWVHFILILPLDTLFVSSTIVASKRWFNNAIGTTLGFTLGGTVSAFLTQTYGTLLIEKLAPGMVTSPLWTQSEAWMKHDGIMALGVFSLIPLTLHPLVALAGIERMPLPAVAACLFLGRLFKYTILASFCAYLPTKLPLPKDVVDLIRNEPKTDAK